MVPSMRSDFRVIPHCLRLLWIILQIRRRSPVWAISVVLTLCVLLKPSFALEDTDLLQKDLVLARIKSGFALLNQTYWSPTLNIWLDAPGDDVRGHYDGRRNPPWWPSANAVETLLDFMTVSGTRDYDASIEAMYETHRDYRNKRTRIVAELKRRNQWSERDERALQKRAGGRGQLSPTGIEYYTEFRNEYLDDSGWWGLTWLKMYDRKKDQKYLATAKAIHEHMASNWKPDLGGGVMWCEDPDKLRTNAITNSLFLILSARLYQRTHEQAFLMWAERTLDWFRVNALYDGTGVVDAPGHERDYWSYNQGAFIGGLTACYEATGKPVYLQQAAQIADSALTRAGLTSEAGVIVEKLGTTGDASLFKGVFVRYLAHLRDILRATKEEAAIADKIDLHIRRSAASLLQHFPKSEELFGADWIGGGEDPVRNFNTQTSALTALVAVLRERAP